MNQQNPFTSSRDPQVEHCDVSIAPAAAHETPASQPAPSNRRPSKFDAVAKARVCDLVSFGKTIAEAARIVGVSQRTVYYGRDNDPEFKQQLHESYDDPTLVCMKTMKQCAADGDRKAAMDYWKALEPERFNPSLRAERRAKQTIDEFRRCLSSIMTDEQLEELDRRLNAKPRKRRRRN